MINKNETSQLKKKLLLYFILVAIVSISVSAEIILELSSSKFAFSIKKQFYNELGKSVSKKKLKEIKANFNHDSFIVPISQLRDRMILLLLVVSVSIVGALLLFAKDIVTPMDRLAEATKKIAEGDLTVKVPVMSDDEIGLVAGLINDINVRLNNMIMEMRNEIEKHKLSIEKVSRKVSEIFRDSETGDILETKKMKVSDFKKMMYLSKEIEVYLENLIIDMGTLKNFVHMYKTFKVESEVSQQEIEKALLAFSEGREDDDEEGIG